MNPLVRLQSEKQSYWLDFIRRNLMTSGELKKMIEDDGLRGMTSNPTIFQKAIEAGDEYDASIKKYAKPGKSADDIFETIAIEDIQAAANDLKSVYDLSEGLDGYVSLEVKPTLAFDALGTLEEAKKLFKKVNRKNLMIKIPGTLEGLLAIEEATTLGININVTLLFSVDIYKKVVEAYIKGLERRVKKKKSISGIQSVASFFVSRVDTAVDKQLDKIIQGGGSNAGTAKDLLHKIAVANAKLAYEHYEKAFNSPRFKKLAKKGGNDQRLLWASTGTKDERLSNVYYIEELIGPHTVNTMPPVTAHAFKESGKVEPRLKTGLKEAKQNLKDLKSLGIDIKKVTDTLQVAGVNAFIQSFDDLIRAVTAKRELLMGDSQKTSVIHMANLSDEFNRVLSRVDTENWVARIWAKDANLWKSEASHQKIIRNSLGWLTITDVVKHRLSEVSDIVKSVKKGKFTHALLLGMGGSSLCPEVLRLTFGKKSGYPDFAILDSTEPASVLERASRSKPEKTLYVVASKSGSTIEPNAFLSYFFDQVKKEKGTKAGENFIAITDPGTQMESLAKKKKFRAIVLNPSDIGGRYSALSFFGMLPAALMGVDLNQFIDHASRMAGACSPLTPDRQNPGALLGVALGVAAKAGRNKVTFFLSKDIKSFGTWVEQLIAESTGKEGVGILPIESEPIQSPEAYGNDRVFVSIQTKKNKDKALSAKLKKLEEAGHPVIQIECKDKYGIAKEFFRWEFATAVAGAVLKINPFDQPNVQEAKDLAKKLIADYKSSGKLPQENPIFKGEGVTVYGQQNGSTYKSLEDVFQAFLKEGKPHDYVALLAFITRDQKNNSALQEMRSKILKSKKLATTLGFGPRYLHSTGQLHKGGDNHGLFISITADDSKDINIPGEGYTYSVLKEAQARGDKAALRNKNRRILHLHFDNLNKGLAKLRDLSLN